MDVQEHLCRIRQLRQGLRREEVAIARQMLPAEKCSVGLQLFDTACEKLKANIREVQPDATAHEVSETLRSALDAVRWLENLGCAVQLPNADLYENMLKR